MPAFQAQRAQLQRSGAAAAAALARAEAEAADARREAEAKRREAQRLAEEEATRASQLVLLEKALEELGAELHNLQESTHSLEVTLDMEKTSSKGLEDSVADAEEKRRGSERECQRLSELLESLSVSGSNLASLAKAVSAKQQEQLQLTQELANKKRDALLQTQSIQGRLDETRMLKDQLSEARGTDAPNDTCAAELLALTASLAEARGKAEEARSRRQQLEAEATELERQLEAQGSQQQNQDNMDKEQSASLEQSHAMDWKPKKSTRRRIVCPVREAGSSLGSLPKLPELSNVKDRNRSDRTEKPLALTVRVMYFSHDGTQADTGSQVSLQLSTSSTVEELLRSVRESVGCEKGRLLFRMRPLTDMAATLEECGVVRDPHAVHLLLGRRHRPKEVVERAAQEAAELQLAMSLAAAEAALRPKRRKAEAPDEKEDELS
ncbi:unnamed protein product [Effrenium voratum]|uniref:Ubiquitin-like domain-containing protein n=1 Tax=Effrenium voratum TaxID=2562239 RepID=A0AA36I4Q7_9DINO|nr:unnamed protein product [Effrenium voratum]